MSWSQYVPIDLQRNLVEAIRLAYTETCFILFHHPPFEQDAHCTAFHKALEEAYVSVCYEDENGRTQFDYNQIETDKENTKRLLQTTCYAWEALWKNLDEKTQDNIYHLYDLMLALDMNPQHNPPARQAHPPGANPPNVYTFTNRDGYSRHTRDNPRDGVQNAQLGNMLTRVQHSMR